MTSVSGSLILNSSLFVSITIMNVLTVANGAAADAKLKPVTVCEVLEDIPRYSGQMVAVVGRLSSNLFDGAWLSEGSCRSSVERRDPNWPYAIALGCFVEKRPAEAHPKLSFDNQVLQAKLKRLRQTTTLQYHDVFVISTSGNTKTLQKKETWSVVYGRITAAPLRDSGFGAVHAKTALCASAEGGRLDIDE